MDKPFTLAVKETRMKLAEVCNESGLPPIVLDLIVESLYSEIHMHSEQQAFMEKRALEGEKSDEKSDEK